MDNIQDEFNMLTDIMNVGNALLERKGLSHFGVIYTEDNVKQGYCYQEDGVFVFVNNYGEEIKRPFMISQTDEFSIWIKKLVEDESLYPTRLLHYNERRLNYRICYPSCKDYCSIYKNGIFDYFFILCPNGKSIPIGLYPVFYEFIKENQYFYLTSHESDYISNSDMCDSRDEDDFFPYRDVFFNLKTSELFSKSLVIKYKTKIIVICINPFCTVVFDENMTELYRKGEGTVFCRIGQKAYLIFEKSKTAYNIDNGTEKNIEVHNKYYNYYVGKGYLIRYEVTCYLAEEVLRGEGYNQYYERIPQHEITKAVVYNANLDVVRELFVTGIFNDIVDKEGRILLWFSREGNAPCELFFDINGKDIKIYDNQIYKDISVPDIIEGIIYDNK